MRLLFTIAFCVSYSFIYSQIITTVAGNGKLGYLGDSGLAINAQIDPFHLCFDSHNNMFIAETHNNVIRKVDAKTGIITTIAGNGTAGFSGDSGLAVNAQLNNPWSIAIDSLGNIYFSDEFNNRIRKINSLTGVITTIAGASSSNFYSGDGGLAINANFNNVTDICLDSADKNLYLCEKNRIRKIDFSTGLITTIAGNGSIGTINGDGGLAINATVNDPIALAIDKKNNIYISEFGDYKIREINAVNGIINTIAGNGKISDNNDSGLAKNVAIGYVYGIAIDANNNLYLPDWYISVVRKMNLTDGIITKVAGTGKAGGYNGDEILATEANLGGPWGIAIDSKNNFYLPEEQFGRVRKVTIDSFALPVSLLAFTAQKQNNTSLLQWQTANEINNSYFNVDRSPDARTFTNIGKVNALNGSNKNNYSFIDNEPLQGINYYRLKQVDKDGKFTYSKIVSLDFNNSVFTVSPNPADNQINISLPTINSISQLIVYDVSGKKVVNEQIAANINSKQINISSLPAGIYNVVLLQNGKQQSVKVIKK